MSQLTRHTAAAPATCVTTRLLDISYLIQFFSGPKVRVEPTCK